MATYEIGYFVGSPASGSVDRWCAAYGQWAASVERARCAISRTVTGECRL
jgi:hypothetical protein